VSPLVIVFLTVFVDLLGFGIIIPLLPFYAERFGGSAQTVALLSASFSAMQFIFMPIWGRLSDRIGRRPILLLGLFGSFVSYLVFGLAGSLPLLFVSRMFAGIAGATVSTAQAVVADTTTSENRAKGMGLLGAAFGLGFVFGPAIGGLMSRWGHAAPPLFASALSLVNFAVAWFMLPETRPAHVPATARAAHSRLESLKNALTRPTLPALLLIYVTVVTAFSGFETTFALFSERRFAFTEETIGYFFAFVGVVLSIVQGGLVGRAVKRFGERRLVTIGLALLGVGLALVAFSRSVPELVMANFVMTVGMAFNSPALTALISKRSDPEDQGGILGVTQGLASLGRIVGPAWGGYLFDRWGLTSPYLSSATLILVACGISIVALGGRAQTVEAGSGRRVP
jgi:MFS transporter, DHA1 family, tetracycline resistance protein